MAVANPTATNSGPRPAKSAAGAAELLLTVTGSDAEGKLFRETVTPLRVEGKNCTYRSKNRVRNECWLMVEFRRGPQDPQTWRAGAQVKAVSSVTSGSGKDLFRVTMELDRAYDAVTIHEDEEAASGEIPAPAATGASRVPVEKQPATIETPLRPTGTPPAVVPPVPIPDGIWAAQTGSENTGASANGNLAEQASAAVARTAVTEGSGRNGRQADAAANIAEASLLEVEERLHDSLVAEYERQMAELKTTISEEVEKAAQDVLTARMAGILEAAVETRMTQYAETVPAITDKVVEKLAGHLAKIPQLEASLGALSKGLNERWAEISQKSAEAAQQTVGAKIAGIEAVAKEMIGGLETRLGAHRAEFQRIVEFSDAAIKESAAALLKAQETMQRLSEITEAAAPLLEPRLREHLESSRADFTGKIDGIVIERAAQFLSEIELLLASRIASADQTMHELAERLQSSEELLKAHEESLRASVSVTTAQVDKEIRAVLRRLAGTERGGPSEG